MKRGRRRHNQKGRNEDHQYWNLPYSIAHSAAFRRLSGPALKVLLELRCRYNGGNNGRIFLSYQEAANFLGLSKTTVYRAYIELQDVGFIKLKRQGHWFGRKASEWILTFVELDGLPATHDWKQWVPKVPLKPTKKVEPRYPDGTPRCFEDAA